ncbi:hypothetical protein LTR05_004510 [Lithohypha guttulata]|uniref:HpcH/HpaI aldolase/citrate lyase domain-containing protein n=1 Tax=Lithohypha guttulata TaxID=1690604 RepID=A0AAN7Y5X3_9EURO|nr:hypothetical protein LTR05_004510 [Lithohypha guttulata]
MEGAFQNNLVALKDQDKVCKALGIKFITSPEIVYLARNAGFQALFIDLEHSSLSLETAGHLCVAGMNAGVTPFVRVPGRAEAGFIQRVLDNGSQGVVFPHVDTPEQAQMAVRASKYPPLGKRSITAMMPHYGYRAAPIAAVTEVGNSQLSTVIVMIESPEAVENIDAIASTQGVDVILIGTNDLSIELDCPGDFDNPNFIEAIEKIAASARKHNRILGVAGIYNRPDLMHRFLHEWGTRFVLGVMDLSLIAKAAAGVATELTDLEEPKDYATMTTIGS